MVMSSSLHKPLIEWVGFFNSTGYGQATASNVLALHNSGKYRLRIRCLHSKPDRQSFTPDVFRTLCSLSEIPESSNAIQVLQCTPPFFHKINLLSRKIAFGAFETFDPPSDWVTVYNRCDALLCPSEFNREHFVKAGVMRPSFTLPHVLDLNIWNDQAKPLDRFPEFTFLFLGTWRKRKGWEALLEAWMSEFSIEDRVRLIIKTDKADKAEGDAKIVKSHLGKKEIAPITFERSIFDDRQMASLIKSADCMVCPTLGEGFGLPGLQSMAVRVPLIVTNFSGCQEYAKPELCTLLEPSGFMILDSLDPIPQFSQKKWPRIKVSSIREAMRQVLSKYEEAQQKADKAYAFSHAGFGYSNFVQRFEKVMETLYRGGRSKNQSSEWVPG